MHGLLLQGFVLGNAAGDSTGYRGRLIVVVHPLQMKPGPLAKDEIIEQKQRLDIERSQGYGGLLQQPAGQGMPPCGALVVAA